ncbi:MAG: HGGxSTG domain-containing protein [Xanthobacteraceae bacterium]
MIRSRWRRRRKNRPFCGAKTRAGGACMVRVEFGKARCRFHGGLSTGPKTEAGRARIAEAQRRRWRAYREGRKGASPATAPICEAS